MKLHGAHILQANQPKAVRAAVIARRQRKAAAEFSARAWAPSSPVRRRSFLEL